MRLDKAGFLRPIAVKRTGALDSSKRAIWELTEDLCFYSQKLDCWFITPAGFHTNFASVPRVPFAYLWYGDICWEEPAGHDYPYTFHELLVVLPSFWDGYVAGDMKPVAVACSKEDADNLFLEALLANPDVPDGSAKTMHKAVSWFGSSSWEAPTTVGQPLGRYAVR